MYFFYFLFVIGEIVIDVDRIWSRNGNSSHPCLRLSPSVRQRSLCAYSHFSSLHLLNIILSSDDSYVEFLSPRKDVLYYLFSFFFFYFLITYGVCKEIKYCNRQKKFSDFFCCHYCLMVPFALLDNYFFDKTTIIKLLSEPVVFTFEIRMTTGVSAGASLHLHSYNMDLVFPFFLNFILLLPWPLFCQLVAPQRFQNGSQNSYQHITMIYTKFFCFSRRLIKCLYDTYT